MVGCLQFIKNADIVPVSSLSSMRFLLILGKCWLIVRKNVSSKGRCTLGSGILFSSKSCSGHGGLGNVSWPVGTGALAAGEGLG